MSMLRAEARASLHGLKHITFWREMFSSRLVPLLVWAKFCLNNQKKQKKNDLLFTFPFPRSIFCFSCFTDPELLLYSSRCNGRAIMMGRVSFYVFLSLPNKPHGWGWVPPSAFACTWISLSSEDRFHSMHNLCQTVIATTVKWLHLCLNGFARTYGIFFFSYVKMYFPGIKNENLQGKAMWVNT